MTSLPQVLKSIQDEYEAETGSRPAKKAAEVMFDRMCAAFVEKMAGAGVLYAAREDRRCADYLKNQWVGAESGKDGARLRAACRYLDGVTLSKAQLALIEGELKAEQPEEEKSGIEQLEELLTFDPAPEEEQVPDGPDLEEPEPLEQPEGDEPLTARALKATHLVQEVDGEHRYLCSARVVKGSVSRGGEVTCKNCKKRAA